MDCNILLCILIYLVWLTYTFTVPCFGDYWVNCCFPLVDIGCSLNNLDFSWASYVWVRYCDMWYPLGVGSILFVLFTIGSQFYQFYTFNYYLYFLFILCSPFNCEIWSFVVYCFLFECFCSLPAFSTMTAWQAIFRLFHN